MSDTHSFFAGVEAAHEANITRFSDTLNIVVVGNVSSGKSSLINAVLGRDRNTMVASVGAEAGTTTRLNSIKLDDHVRIIDSPGLIDIQRDNSKITKEFLKFVDIGILVLTGAADAVQRAHLQHLQQACARTFVVLNKVDHWDRHKPEALAKVEAQWKEALGIGTLYKVCCFGYEPDDDPETKLDIRGVEDLRKDIETFLAYKGKDMLLVRHLHNKEHSATIDSAR
ncbi:MAG: 50S ribosome-binding GTPase [Gallionella sp.]|nr:50S ribosome-binding GTPase [Gallionella sp.]MDD4958018.1 50S ribosome-binding GTPase [Gallionella sp.]